MRSSLASIVVCVMTLGIASSGASEGDLDVRIVLRGRAPGDIIVQAFIDPDVRNRGVQVIVDSQDFYASSTLQLEGARAARTQQVRFRHVPAGQYLIRVTLWGSDGERARHVTTVVFA